MEIKKAEKKLEKNGFQIVGNMATLEGSNYHIEFLRSTNGYETIEICCIKVQRNGVIDHPEYDDFNGTYCNNLTQAIRYCKNWNF
jgi:hypothetical protein